MVAPWVVVEDGRSYQLKVTQVIQKEVMGNTVDISDKLEPSNKKDNNYELHIVAPPADKDGKVTYKKITSNHKFLKKECDLKMLVKRGNIEKAISEGGSFEIDSDGQIKGGLNTDCEKQAAIDIKKQEAALRYIEKYKATQEAYNITINNFETSIRKEEQTPHNRKVYMEFAEKARDSQISQWQKDLETEIKKIDNEYETAVDSKNGFKDLIISIINPDYRAKEIKLIASGSKKCKSQPTVSLYIHEKAIYKGEISLAYGFSHTLTEKITTSVGAHRNDKIDVIRSAFRVEGKLDYALGNTHYIIEGKHTKGFDENDDRQVTSSKRKPQHLKRIDAENIFSNFREKINNFHRFFEKVQKAQSSPISINTGLTKFTFKADGSTDENQNDYDLARRVNNLEFEIALFDGSAITLDLIELGCTIGGPIGKVISKARTYAEDKNQEIKLEFSMGGNINGNLKFTKPNDINPWSAEGNLSGAVNVEILGKVHLEGSVLWVSVAAGAYFKSASKESIDNKTEIKANLYASTKKDKISIDGNLTFNGMTIYFASYLEIGKKNIASNEESNGGLQREQHAQLVTKREFEAKGKWELIDAWDSGKHNFGKIENILA
jgi:hypothetical protein